MKWFKHDANSSADEIVASIEARFGLNGYARYFKLLEAVSAQMEPSKGARATATYSTKRWQILLGCKKKNLTEFLSFLEKKNEIITRSTENGIEIRVPKLLRLADEYFRKSLPPPERLPTKKGDGDIEGEEIKLEEE